MKFITLESVTGNIMYVNINAISCFFTDNNGYTELYVIGDSEPLNVKESPFEIKKLIELYK